MIDKKYVKPELEILKFEADLDIITASFEDDVDATNSDPFDD